MHPKKPAPPVSVATSDIAAISDHEAVTLFLLESVKDIQGTIRAIDTKVSILLAALSIPVKNIADAFATWHRPQFHAQFSDVAALGAILAYFVAVIVSIRTLSGIGDASRHVRGGGEHNAFYAGGLYAFRWIDGAFNRSSVLSRRTLDECVGSVPRSFAAVVIELTSETMSLAYVRDLKHHRQRLAYGATIVAALLALSSILL